MIKGHFIKNIYHQPASGYTVAIFELEDSPLKEDVVVTGYLPQLDKEASYRLYGDYIDHPKYGVQYKIESFEKCEIDDESELVKYFSSAQFKGVGKVLARNIVNTLGPKAISLIREDPECLLKVPKINEKTLEAIKEGVGKEENEHYFFFTSHHLTMQQVIKLEHHFGEQLMSVVVGNPYMIMEVNGIGFNTADKFAQSLGFGLDHPFRLAALCETMLMQYCLQSGDSYLDYEEFKKRFGKDLNGIETDLDSIINNCIANNRIIIEDNRLYTPSQYEAETFIAQYLSFFPYEGFKKVDRELIDYSISEIEEELGIEYQEKQKEAIEAFFENDLMILTGGPGTGKTTIVRGMVELCKRIYPQYSITLAAPTGRAAKRLAQLTDCDARTLHSLLRWDKETGTFLKNEEDPVFVDLLIIDEFSMVDQWVFYNLLKAGAHFKKIIIIGDQDQLPSVSIGCVLKDLIDCQLFKVVKLEKIYRQKEGSDIIALANDIRKDECSDICTENDIRFFNCENGDVRRLCLQIVERALNTYDNLYDGFMNVQVLAPRYQGLNGIDSLNVALQAKFNPAAKNKRELKVGYRTYRENDKILQLKNQPDDNVFNGDIGILVEIIYEKEDVAHQNRMVVDFEGTIVEYTAETFANITHAYCISVHKAQGSEYPIVIMPLVNEYGIMLQKRLIYTAVSRANKSLIMLGNRNAFFTGISRKEYYERKTTLADRLIRLFNPDFELAS